MNYERMRQQHQKELEEKDEEMEEMRCATQKKVGFSFLSRGIF